MHIEIDMYSLLTYY